MMTTGLTASILLALMLAVATSEAGVTPDIDNLDNVSNYRPTTALRGEKRCICNQCAAGCATSFWDSKNCNCNEPAKGQPVCRHGAWGGACHKTCPAGQNCSVPGCSQRYGTCNRAPDRKTPACLDGFWGPGNVHDEGYYRCDKQCADTAPGCTVDGKCGAGVGDCTAPPKGSPWCRKGFWGEKVIAYSNHIFCNKRCSPDHHCTNEEGCGSGRGECLQPTTKGQPLCKEGYFGPDFCDTPCPSSNHCGEKGCEPRQGRCFEPPRGKPWCEEGYYGLENCDKSCPSSNHCAEKGCEPRRGECFQPSERGKPLCQTGYYGSSNCDKECPKEHHCTLPDCGYGVGDCLPPSKGSGRPICEDGFWGWKVIRYSSYTTCHNKCPTNCKDDKCDPGGDCFDCKSGWKGMQCRVPDVDDEALKRLADKMLGDILDEMASEEPAALQCVYNAASIAQSWNGGVQASQEARDSASTKDKIEAIFDQVKASKDAASAILDAFNKCSDQIPPAVLQQVDSAVKVATKVSPMTPDEFRKYFEHLTDEQKASLEKVTTGMAVTQALTQVINREAIRTMGRAFGQVLIRLAFVLAV